MLRAFVCILFLIFIGSLNCKRHFLQSSLTQANQCCIIFLLYKPMALHMPVSSLVPAHLIQLLRVLLISREAESLGQTLKFAALWEWGPVHINNSKKKIHIFVFIHTKKCLLKYCWCWICYWKHHVHTVIWRYVAFWKHCCIIVILQWWNLLQHWIFVSVN